MASEPLFVDPEVIVDIGTDVTLAFPGGFLAGAAAVDAGGGFEGLATRGTPVADMAAGADLVFAGSQALVTKFHGISPVLYRCPLGKYKPTQQGYGTIPSHTYGYLLSLYFPVTRRHCYDANHQRSDYCDG
jgi:hypothetical protein